MDRYAVRRLPPRVVREVRSLYRSQRTPKHPYHSAESHVGTGKATCRGCGQLIMQGEKAIRFQYSPDADRPWMRHTLVIHEGDCGGDDDWVRCPRCDDDIELVDWPTHWRNHRYGRAVDYADPVDGEDTCVAESADIRFASRGGKEQRAMQTTKIYEWHAMHIGEGEERKFYIPAPVEVPIETPVEEPSPVTPETIPDFPPAPAEPVKTPEKVPAGAGARMARFGGWKRLVVMSGYRASGRRTSKRFGGSSQCDYCRMNFDSFNGAANWISESGWKACDSHRRMWDSRLAEDGERPVRWTRL